MLASGGLVEATGAAGVLGAEEDVVVWVGVEVRGVGCGCDLRRGCCHAEVGEEVGSAEEEGDGEGAAGGEVGVDRVEEERGAACEEAEEDDLR